MSKEYSENKKENYKIICLFFPPVFKDINFKKIKKKKEINYFDSNNEKKENISSFLNNKNNYEKLVLVNYPKNQKELNSLVLLLEKKTQKINEIILFHTKNYEIFEEKNESFFTSDKNANEKILSEYLISTKNIVEKILSIFEKDSVRTKLLFFEENEEINSEKIIKKVEEIINNLS